MLVQLRCIYFNDSVYAPYWNRHYGISQKKLSTVYIAHMLLLQKHEKIHVLIIILNFNLNITQMSIKIG